MINLVKGQKVDLTKGNSGLKSLRIGLGWDVNRFDDGAFDLDACAFLLNADGKARIEGDMVYYHHLQHDSGAVKHCGDNLTGEGSGDDEVISVELDKVPADIEKIDFTVSIYDAENRMQNFGMVQNAYVRIVNEATNEELMRYDLSEDYSTETAMVMGELYRYNGEWKFTAIGKGYGKEKGADGVERSGLERLVYMYGLNV